MNALRLSRIVVVQEQLRVLGKKWPAVLVVAVASAAGGAHHLFGWNAVHLLGVYPHEIPSCSGLLQN